MRTAGLCVVFGLASVLGMSACAPPKGLDGQPAVIIEQPAAGAKITSPLHVTGTADVFEATFRMQLLGPGGTVLSDQQVMASCGTGCRGTFDITMGFPTQTTGDLKLKAYEFSAKDGHRIDLAAVTLTA